VAAKFIKNVLGLLPGYRHVSGIFYPASVGEVLFGYTYSKQSAGIQCYLYVLPLYLRTKLLHLGFSVYMPSPLGYISITSALEKRFLGREGKYASVDDPGVALDLVDACLNFRASNFRYEESIDGFMQMLIERSQPGYDGPLGPLMVDVKMRLYALAASLVLKGKRDLAMADLAMIFDKDAFDRHVERPTEFYTVDLRDEREKKSKMSMHIIQDKGGSDVLMDDAKQLYNLLGKDIVAAQDWLKEIERENKVLFKIK
jgi:hypothetical protein